MKKFLLFSPSGEFMQYYASTVDPEIPGVNAIAVDDFEDGYMSKRPRMVNGQVVYDPVDTSEPPSPHHVRDPQTHAWVLTDAGASAALRAQRDALLAQSDWTDTLSSKNRLGDALYNAWQDYRQILRDIPGQAGFPFDVAWPEPPSPT